MSDQDRQQTFIEFERMTKEIMEHKDQIEKIDFSSRLKNGTRFTFAYNLRGQERKKKANGKLDQTALFNGIFDIIAIGISIALLTILVIYSHGARKDGLVVTYSLFGSTLIIYNLFSALFHFFSNMSSTRQIFEKLKSMFQFFVVIGAFTPVYLQFIKDPKDLLLFMTILVMGAIGIFFTYTDTQSSRLVSRILCGIMPLVILTILPTFSRSFGSEATILLGFSSLLYALWGISPLLWKRSKTASMNFSNFFMVTGSLGFFWLFLGLM
jgi:channel protein (hemolysin III family)